MQASGGFLCAFAGFENGGVLVELALLDAHVDAHNILPNDASSADVQMSITSESDVQYLNCGHRDMTENRSRTRLQSCPSDPH